jgi:hypothetical protein
MEGNTLLSTTAQKATKRIRTLRALSQKTGIQTTEEQIRILLALDDEDVLTVADAVGMKMAGGAR